jgi:hypothetical protein
VGKYQVELPSGKYEIEADNDADLEAAVAELSGEAEAPAPEAAGYNPTGLAGVINDVYEGTSYVDRAIVQAVPAAVAGLPALAADAYDSLSNGVVMGYNAIAPRFGGKEISPIQPFRHSNALGEIGDSAADAMGLPEPTTKMGQGALKIGSAALSAFGGAGLAAKAGTVAGAAPAISAPLQALADAPMLQAAGAAGATVATDLAQSMGVQHPLLLAAVGMLGGTTPGAATSATRRVAGGVGQLYAPFRSVGEDGFLPGISRDVIAGKVLNKLATTPGITPQALEAATPILPGSNPTIAQVSRDPGLIGAESGIRNALDNGAATSGRISQRNTEQNTARQAALDRITLPSRAVPEGGAPQRGTLEYAEAKRDAAVDQNKRAAFEGAAAFGLGDTSHVLSRIQAIRRSPEAGPRKAVQDAMDFAEERLTQPGVNLNDPETLYSIRKDLGLARDGKYNTDKSDLRLAKGELQTVIGVLDNAIDSAAPGYRRYMDLYAKRSIPLNQQKALQDLRERGQVSGSDQVSGERILTLGKYGTAVRKAIATGVLGPGPGNGNLSQAQMNTVINVVEDLDRGAATTAATIKPPGSDTFKNFSVAAVIGRIVGDGFPDTAAGRMTQTIAKPLGWMYSLPDEAIGQLLVEATLDPRLAARLMRQANAHEVQSIAAELAERVRKQTQGAAVYGAANQQ